MSITRKLASLFAAAGVALALLIPAGAGSSGSLLAQAEKTADCGGYNSSLCKETESCVGWFWAKTCTTYYFYWPPAEKKDDDPENKDQPG